MAKPIVVKVDGLREAHAALRRAGAKADDLEKVNLAAAKIVAADAARRAPKRSGKLARSLDAESNKRVGIVTAGGEAVPYAGVIEYGWVTRGVTAGMSRKEAQQRFDGILTRRAINKSVRGQKARTVFYRDKTTGYREVRGRTGAVRGGPIKPRPYISPAIKGRTEEVIARYEQHAKEIADVFNKGT